MTSSWPTCAGLSASMTWRRTVATCPGAAATTASQPAVGEPGVGGAAVLGAREPLDQAAVLQPAYDVGEPRQRGVGALRRATVIRSVRSGASESIASTKYSKWVSPASRAQLRVEHAGQQLDHRDQPHPGRALARRPAICVSMAAA